MARTRVNRNPDHQDLTPRSSRKKYAGKRMADEKKALFHCNYCNKDITGKIRMKCDTCADFDSCIECFTVGAEVFPHKSDHPYMIMDNLDFSLTCPDWSASEEQLLLEGLSMFGLFNWADVAVHVGTKNKEQCDEHYTKAYLNSPNFPLPDFSYLHGKNKTEILGMGTGVDEKGSPLLGEHNVQKESSFPPSRVNAEEMHKGGAAGCSQSGLNAGKEYSSLGSISGYNPKRNEFDIEYDNEAEKLLADMEFFETDTKEERELKLRIVGIYNKRLDERERRKKFVLERNLLYTNAFENDFSPEEKALCQRYDCVMRLHSKKEHEDLLKVVISEYRTKKRLDELKEARAAGCRTRAEADKYLQRKREALARIAAQVGTNNQGGQNPFMTFSNSGTGRQASSSSNANNLHYMGAQESNLLSESEKRMCSEIQLHPAIYLRMQELMSMEIFKGNVAKKSDAHQMFQLESSKIDRVYDMLVKKGIAPP